MNAKTIVNRLLEDYDPDLDEVSPESISHNVEQVCLPTHEVFSAWCTAMCDSGLTEANRIIPGFATAVYAEGADVNWDGYLDFTTSLASTENQPIGARFFPKVCAEQGKPVTAGFVAPWNHELFVCQDDDADEDKFFGEFEPEAEDTLDLVAKEYNAFIANISRFYRTTSDIIEEFKDFTRFT